MRLKLTIEVVLEDGFYNNTDEEKLWLENEILVGDGSLFLHSNEIGDTVGEIKKVTNVQWIDDELKNNPLKSKEK